MLILKTSSLQTRMDEMRVSPKTWVHPFRWNTETHIYGIPYSNKRRQQGTSDKIKMVVQWDTLGICLQIQMDRLFLFVFSFNSLLFSK